MTTVQRMASLLAEWMVENDVTQAQLARLTGRTPKHINQVFSGKAGTGELDYWAFVLGLTFNVTLDPKPQP